MRTSISSTGESLRDFIDREAGRLGFDCVAVASPDAIPLAAGRLGAFVAAGHHGSMQWLSDTAPRRGSPHALWPEVRSIVMLGVNYGPDSDPLDILASKDRGAISVYAQNRDYHDVVKGKLKQLAGKIAARSGAEVKVFVDTAPVMEKPLAEAAGLGWQGKHTNLVSREFGSWLFLGSIFTTAELEPDSAEEDRCGSCRACLDICPTDAFPAPYRLDARRCISYLTIENKGPIPLEFRAAIGNRIYGCDDCLAVCPWNKFAQTASEAKLAARDDLRAPALADLLGARRWPLPGAVFGLAGQAHRPRPFFAQRADRRRQFGRRGACRSLAAQLLADPSPLVRGAAVWALSRLLGEAEFAALAKEHAAAETDADVLSEWRNAGRRRSACLQMRRTAARHDAGASSSLAPAIPGAPLRSSIAGEAFVAGTTRSPKNSSVCAPPGSSPTFSTARPFRMRSDRRWPTRRISSFRPRRTRPAIRCSAPDAMSSPASMPRLAWIGYLSTVGVYGDHGGGWVDEIERMPAGVAPLGDARRWPNRTGCRSDARPASRSRFSGCRASTGRGAMPSSISPPAPRGAW